MTRSIFPAYGIEHIWIHGRYLKSGGNYAPVETGHTANYSARFTKDEFYSYSTQIAQRYVVTDREGKKWLLYLVNSTNYSVTTAKQQREIYHAIPSMQTYDGEDLPTVKVCADMREFPLNANDTRVFSKWIELLLGEIPDLTTKASKARQSRDNIKRVALSKLYDANILQQLIPNSDNYGAVINSYRAMLDLIPPYIPGVKVSPGIRYITDWTEALGKIPNIAGLERKHWHQCIRDEQMTPFSGEIDSTYHYHLSITSAAPAMMRIISSQVLTNQGVRMSLSDAKLTYRHLLKILNDSQSHPSSVAGYSVFYSPSSNTISIGCHHWHITNIVADYMQILSHEGKITKDSNNEWIVVNRENSTDEQVLPL